MKNRFHSDSAVQKLLYILLTASFIVIFFSQVIIITDKPILSAYSELSQTNGDDLLQSQIGQVVLRLEGAEPSESIRVLVNGNLSALFTSRMLNLVVADNSVIEIDGRAMIEPFSVEAVSHTKNITLADNKRFAYIDRNIKPVVRVMID